MLVKLCGAGGEEEEEEEEPSSRVSALRRKETNERTNGGHWDPSPRTNQLDGIPVAAKCCLPGVAQAHGKGFIILDPATSSRGCWRFIDMDGVK